MQRPARVTQAFALCLLCSACLRSALLDTRINAASSVEESLETLHDYEIGRAAAEMRVAELEGLLRESAGDERVLLLLARAWSRLTFAFTLDSQEQALEAEDTPLAAYHASRARAGYERAFFFADRWLEAHATGYTESSKQPERLSAFLSDEVDAKRAAEPLLWAGFARLGYAEVAPQAEDAALERNLGLVLLRHSLVLQSELAFGTARLALAVHLSRGTESERRSGETELQKVATASRNARLLVPLIRARYFACKAQDRAAFEEALQGVLAAGDPEPDLRLENAVAKRRASRYLTSTRIGDECFPPADVTRSKTPNGR